MEVGKKIWVNGKLVPPEQATVSVFDHGVLYGDGVFEGIRIYGGRIFKLGTHLRRLYRSAEAIRLDVALSIEEMEQATRQTVEANGLSNGYIRLCVTRGSGTLGLNPFECRDGAIFIIADSIKMYPQEYYDNGLAVITARTIRNHSGALSPGIKSMNYLNNIMAKVEAIDVGLLEAVMLNHEGNVAECTGDNIFIVRQENGAPMLISPPLDAGVLEGVTMNVVIDLAKAAGIAFKHENLKVDDLYNADEMFLTGTAAEVIPVTKIDDREIGSGKPGPVTQQLRRAFGDLVSENAPED